MHVVEIAATDVRLRGAIAQCPLVDGLAGTKNVPLTQADANIGARIRGEARVPPQKILKTPLSVQLGIDETSSDALNEMDAEVGFRELFRARGNRRTKPSLRDIGRKTDGIKGGDSSACSGRGVRRGLSRYRLPGRRPSQGGSCSAR